MQIRLELIARGLGFELERLQLHCVAVGRGHRARLVVERLLEVLDLIGRDALVGPIGADRLGRGPADLGVEARELALQLAHVRMIAEQGARGFGDFSLHRDARFDVAAQRFVARRFGKRLEPAAIDHVAERLRLGVRCGLGGAGGGDLRRQLRQALGRRRHAVGASEKSGLGAQLVGLGLELGDFYAQRLDAFGEPVCRRLRLRAARIGLLGEVELGDRVGAQPGKLGILAGKLDLQHPRMGDRKNREPVHEGFDDDVIVGPGARAREHRPDEPAESRGVEFGAAVELQLLNRLARDVGRGERLGGALHGRIVKRRAEVARRLVGLGEVALLDSRAAPWRRRSSATA